MDKKIKNYNFGSSQTFVRAALKTRVASLPFCNNHLSPVAVLFQMESSRKNSAFYVKDSNVFSKQFVKKLSMYL